MASFYRLNLKKIYSKLILNHINSDSDVQLILKEMSANGGVNVYQKDFVKYLKPYLKNVDCVKMQNGQYSIEWTVTSQSGSSQQSGGSQVSSQTQNSQSTEQSQSTTNEGGSSQNTSQQTGISQSTTGSSESNQNSNQSTSQTQSTSESNGKSLKCFSIQFEKLVNFMI